MPITKLSFTFAALAAVVSGFPQPISTSTGPASLVTRVSTDTYTFQTTLGTSYTGPVAIVSPTTQVVAISPATPTVAVSRSASLVPTTNVVAPTKASSALSPTPTKGQTQGPLNARECKRDWGCCKGACYIGSVFTFYLSCCQFSSPF
ncbi:hypothetical protein GGTG_04462 [Gaeumannomyces tritici R3-111a-1]|uniref:CBM1 domain-containing protein n=1 Tax=Gaeumannomyces tritici (strain R3-111a-1) TaxID=644352 RepID=J3NT64_GAET3|nr:hypothetical protein GGTG_04462 [Gaeumannomyces tritici R3-111a-1]EJT79378.1 hypothetical protein GGTG_04462 [Gaeumannomyces tritici R3-111a-1]